MKKSIHTSTNSIVLAIVAILAGVACSEPSTSPESEWQDLTYAPTWKLDSGEVGCNFNDPEKCPDSYESDLTLDVCEMLYEGDTLAIVELLDAGTYHDDNACDPSTPYRRAYFEFDTKTHAVAHGTLPNQFTMVHISAFPLPMEVAKGDLLLVSVRESQGTIFVTRAVRVNADASDTSALSDNTTIDLPHTLQGISSEASSVSANYLQSCPEQTDKAFSTPMSDSEFRDRYHKTPDSICFNN